MTNLPAPGPFYRSRLLWLGLLVLVFFLWSWADSRRFDSWVAVGVSKQSMVILRQGGGSVCLEVVTDTGSSFSPASFASEKSDPKSDPFYDPDDGPPPWFPPAFSHFAWDFGNGSQSQENWVAAWWMIVAAYLAIWTGTVVIWQRRKFRLGVPAIPAPSPP